MPRLTLSAEEAAALSLFAADDLRDPVDLVRRAGRDVGRFFEYGRFEGLDVSRSSLAGVSFRGARLTGTIMRPEQEAEIRATGPALFTDHAPYARRPAPPREPDHSSPEAAEAYAEAKRLTLVRYSQPGEEVRDYVNSMWEHQEHPYGGDVINSYNDGPPSPGAKPLGPFFELETSSPAAARAGSGVPVSVGRTFYIHRSFRALPVAFFSIAP